MTEVIKLYETNEEQLLLNLSNILKSATKNVEKRKKKCSNFFYS